MSPDVLYLYHKMLSGTRVLYVLSLLVIRTWRLENIAHFIKPHDFKHNKEMRFTLSLQALSGLVALTALVTASPLGVHQDDFADLPTVEMKWKGPPGPGLEHTTLNGTAESIYKQLQAINPDYYPQDLLNSIDVSVDATTLDKRKFRNVDCNYAGQLLGYNEIRYHFAYADGIKYLRKLTNGYCGAEPKSCARVSCSWHSAIRLCNPVSFPPPSDNSE